MEWIELTEEDGHFPDINISILVCDAVSEIITLAIFKEENDEQTFVLIAFEELPEDYYITHWMNLPDLPK